MRITYSQTVNEAFQPQIMFKDSTNDRILAALTIELVNDMQIFHGTEIIETIQDAVVEQVNSMLPDLTEEESEFIANAIIEISESKSE